MLSTNFVNSLRTSIVSIAAALIWSVIATSVSGQSAFDPPPPPQATPSAVRGLAAPVAQTTSPANISPPASNASSTLTSPTNQAISPTTPLTSSRVQPLEGGQIVARIDGQIVLASDVLWQVEQLIEANRDRIPPDQMELAKQALMRQQVMGLIDTKMIYADFRRKVPAENMPSIEENLQQPFEDEELPRLVKMLKLNDRSELKALLRKSGASLADVQRQFNERTIAGEWLRQLVPKPKPATHEEMLDYYKEHKQEYEYPAQVKWEEVMIQFNRVNGDRGVAWRAITGIGNDVWQRVSRQSGLRGPIFTEIAKQKSHGFTAKEGGQHDWTTKGALRSEAINQALFSLKIGQLSNVIESERGFHIVRVLDRKEAGCTPFTVAQASIRKELGKGKQQKIVEAEVSKIRKKSRVWTLFDGDLSGPQLSRKLQPSKQR